MTPHLRGTPFLTSFQAYVLSCWTYRVLRFIRSNWHYLWSSDGQSASICSVFNAHSSGWFLQYLHLHLRQKNKYLKCEAKECTQKHSGLDRAFGSEIGRTLGCPAWDSWSREVTLVNTRRIKMPGKIASEQHQWRRRNAELFEIRTLDRWTRVRVQQIPTQRDQKQPLWQTTIAWRTKWMKITFKEDQRHLTNWNQLMMKTCQRRHEWQETFFQFVERTV